MSVMVTLSDSDTVTVSHVVCARAAHSGQGPGRALGPGTGPRNLFFYYNCSAQRPFSTRYLILRGWVMGLSARVRSGRLAVWVGLVTGWSCVRILLRQLHSGTLATPFTPLCHCLSEETLKVVGPLNSFYLVSRCQGK